jgi:dephospho-CoA kinase
MHQGPFIVGLVGGVASGKSEVARRFQMLGADVISADTTGHRLLAEDLETQQEVIELFGRDVLDATGKIDRRRIAARCFGDLPEQQKLRRALEAILHPRIRAASEQQILTIAQANPRSMILLDAPLLIEAGWLPRCSAVVFIDTPLERRQHFASQRGWSVDEHAKREANQMVLDQKRAAATDILHNNGSLPELHLAIDQLYSELNTGLRK